LIIGGCLFAFGDYGFFIKIGTFFGGIGFFSGFRGLGFYLIGIIVAISSSSILSADGSLSEPELLPSSPIVILIRFLF